MGKFSVIRVTDQYESGNETYLDIQEGRIGKSDGVAVAREDVPISDLIQLLDDDAEGANWHNWVGFAETLDKIIRREYKGHSTDKDLSRRVLWAFAQRGGFTGGR